MRVLLCLLSAQHVPNLLSVHHFQPDRLILVESTAMKLQPAAENLLQALRIGGREYRHKHDIEPLASEDHLETIRQSLRRAYGRYASCEWIVNLTGGNKPMAIATYEFFKSVGGRLVYTNIEQPGEWRDIDSTHTEKFNHVLLMKEFLAGYGFESRKSDEKIALAEKRATGWWECARLIAEHSVGKSVLPLSDEERNQARDKGITLASGRCFLDDSISASLSSCFRLTRTADGSWVGRLDKHEVDFLTGGWLEAFFWGLLSRHAVSLGLSDVRLGLEVGARGDSSGNDFDVAFMHTYHLCMMECKSGAQSHDPRLDVLYKVEAVTRQFRALRVKSWLATTSDHVLDRNNGKLKASLANRAAIYNCNLLVRSQIEALARKPDDLDHFRSVLNLRY